MKPQWPARAAVLIIFIALLFVIVYKAVYLPITFDEMSASVFYPTFSVIDIIKYPGNWPSNHVLNSICIKFTEFMFGTEPWSVRLPNMLAFVLLFATLYAMARQYFYRPGILFCVPFIIIFANPYLLDFFGLARGYGMSNAFMGVSVYGLLRYASTLKWRWFFVASLFSMLAAYANFTLLIYWVAAHGILAIIYVAVCIKRKEFPAAAALGAWLVTIIVAVGFAAICYSPLHRMQSTNQFVYWSKNGFFSDTLIDSISRFRSYTNFLPPTDFVEAWCVIILLAFTTLYVIGKFISKGLAALTEPLVVVFILLITVFVINMAQVIALGTPYLNGRTALSYYVLFAFVLMFVLREISEQATWGRNWITPTVTLLFFINLCASLRVNQVLEWYFDANTYQVINYMDSYRKEHPEVKNMDLNTSGLFYPSFGFYAITGKIPWIKLTEQHSAVDTASTTLFYYTVSEETSQLRKYSPVLSFGKGSRILMIRK